MIMGNGGGNKADGEGSGMTGNIDPHKLCQIEADLRGTMRQSDKHQEDIFKLKEVFIL